MRPESIFGYASFGLETTLARRKAGTPEGGNAHVSCWCSAPVGAEAGTPEFRSGDYIYYSVNKARRLRKDQKRRTGLA